MSAQIMEIFIRLTFLEMQQHLTKVLRSPYLGVYMLLMVLYMCQTLLKEQYLLYLMMEV